MQKILSEDLFLYSDFTRTNCYRYLLFLLELWKRFSDLQDLQLNFQNQFLCLQVFVSTLMFIQIFSFYLLQLKILSADVETLIVSLDILYNLYNSLYNFQNNDLLEIAYYIIYEKKLTEFSN